MGISTMKVTQQNARERSGFKVVCEEGGSLSIKVTPAKPSTDPMIACGRCGAARGTLADLHVLARRANDVFEF
jgi:hypothetical protein